MGGPAPRLRSGRAREIVNSKKMEDTPPGSGSSSRVALRGALTTALHLVGGMAIGLLLGFAASGLPLHFSEVIKNALAAIVVLGFLAIVSVRWAASLLSVAGLNLPRRVARIAGLSFAGAFLVAGIGLSRLEFLIVERGVGPRIPIHVLFTLLFVPATILVVGIVGFVFGRELGGRRFGMELAVRCAIPAGLAFLLIDIGMDALGRRVGAPGAAERATMLTVMLIGSLGAALAGGAALATRLARSSVRQQQMMGAEKTTAEG